MRPLQPQMMHWSLLPPSTHNTDRATRAGKGHTNGHGDTAWDTRRARAALWAPLHSLSVCLLPLLWEVEGEHPPRVPLHGQGWEEGKVPGCTPDLSCQGPGPSGLG